MREDLSGLVISGIREDLLSSYGGSHHQRSELSFNETDPALEFPLVIPIPLLGGVSDECFEQSAAFAKKLGEREGWALQSEPMHIDYTGWSY